MAPDFTDSDASLGIGVQNLANKVLALWRKEFGHLVICTHNLFV